MDVVLTPVPGAALIRVAAYPTGVRLPAWPDLTTEQPDAWRTWLRTAWALPTFAATVANAAPELAAQVEKVVNGGQAGQKRLRRLVESVVRYLLRWTTRATPFGTFAGVAPVRFGTRAAARVGDAHHTVARPDGRAVAEHTAETEQDIVTLRAAAVVTNSLGHRRGDRWVLPCARTDGDRRWDVGIRMTGPVRAAVETARRPILFADLAATITETCGGATAERLLAELVRIGVLVSELRPPMTDVTPAARSSRHTTAATPTAATRVAVDLRADIEVTIPPAVLQEAGRAASALIAVAPPMPGWDEYHAAFIERWGPGAAVPVRDVLTVLGFPAGYRASARRVPALHTPRDRLLGQLAQRSALDGAAEVILDDAMIDRLRAGDRPPAPHTELRFTLAAGTVRDLDRGAFTLTVLSGSRHAGVAAARFLHLLTPAERAAFRQAYRRLPTALPGAITVQLSGPPLDEHLAAVARAPELLPVLPVGEFHPSPPWHVDDLAIAGDGARLWLVSRATGQPVEPLLFNSVLLSGLQQPLMRFLTEIWTAGTAPCSRFDWGHASALPFLPRVRRGRSILHPARWIVDQAELPGRTTAWSQWRATWQRLRHQRHIPPQILVGDDDVRVRLDLDDDAQLAVLRSHLDRRATTTITEAPDPADWIDNHPAELLLTLAAPSDRPRQSARPSRPVRTRQHRPGASRWLEARVSGRVDLILADLARRPAGHLPPGWWFLRHPHPEPHVRLRVPLTNSNAFADTACRLARWAHELEQHGVAHDLSLHSYRPETRHGTGAALTAAEAVFTADSQLALRSLDTDRQAATAAGMITLAEGFTGDGPGWLVTNLPRRSGPRLDPAQLEFARQKLHDEQLHTALAEYRSAADADGLDPDRVLGDLLHLHHARTIGVDTASEHHCLRLARTVAHTTCSARHAP